jgi:hypothetical protein
MCKYLLKTVTAVPTVLNWSFFLISTSFSTNELAGKKKERKKKKIFGALTLWHHNSMPVAISKRLEFKWWLHNTRYNYIPFCVLSFAVHNVWHKGLKISVVCAHRHP